MYQSMDQQLQALKRLTIGIFAMAAALLVLSQTAQAQRSCPQTLNDIEWASSNLSNPLTVSQLLNQGPMNCVTPIYFGLHRGAYTRAMDLDSSNHPTFPNLGPGAAAGQGFASPTVLISPAGSFPVFPQSLASVAIPAYQNYLASNSGHLPPNIDPPGTLIVQQGKYNAWPAIIELDPRQDSTGTWYLFHGVYTNSDALTPGIDPNSAPQSSLSTSQATLANDQLLYRAVPFLRGYVGSSSGGTSSAPSIDQMATAQEILDGIMTDPSVNMVLQLHTRSYNETLSFYEWLLQTWAPGHTNAQIVNAIGRIFFCVDLNKMAPPGQGSTTNDYNNLNYLSSWNSAVTAILATTHNEYPTMPIGSFPPVALMVNFYDDTNLNTQTDVNNAFAILQSTRSLSAVKYLGLEITDEDSPINAQLESLGQMAKSQLGMQIGKSVLTGDKLIGVADTGGNAAIKYGAISAATPYFLITGNNAIINGTPFQQLWTNNQANLVDLSYSLSFQLGVQDNNAGSSMALYGGIDNKVTALTQVQPTILLSDLPLIHSAKLNGEVRAVFQGTYISPSCTAGYPGCDDPNTPGQTTYTYCADEGGTCNFTGDRNVAYGGVFSDGNFHYNTLMFTNSAACNESTFGNPNPSYVKRCYVSPPIPYTAGTYCADEGQTCNFGGDAWAIMAASKKYWYAPDRHGYAALFSNEFPCALSLFSPSGNWDPTPGISKACFYQGREGYFIPHSGPAGYVFCSGENDVNGCQFKGLGRVAYGRGTNFNYGVFNGGVGCNNFVFGDPRPGYTKDCFYQSATAVSGATGTEIGNGPPPATGSGTSTCDIYASGGTPCVAAHSTVRALFGGYSGRLYQVQRASDNTTLDVGTLAAGGYANAAAQDSFCEGTTCAITIIYDQTSNHNDLPVTSGDAAAVAPDLPITINGNKAYGVKVTPGVGYRNNVTTGVATGSSPEGMYMVTSGTYVNNGCCFDYGNAETDSGDDGAGRMDALNFGTYCGFPPCSGNGPWVEADLENGQYMGNSNNPSDQSMGYNFVTAMLKNNGTSTFALKGGNSQSGVLTTDYSGTLPTLLVGGLGYIPMNKKGAIILGTGGDNSKWSLGAFFEGAMTSGYPTDAAESAIQANIVAAGYSCDSSGCIGSGGTVVIEPPGPYIGPNDPGGPGPQDGFASPATEQPNDLMGSKPALASFQGSLFVAFQANDAGHTLHVSSSSSGYNFPAATQQPNILIGGTPAMAAFNNQLYIAFQANDPGHTLHVTSSPTGYNFPAAAQEPNILIGSAPAMAVFNGQLCIAFQANDPGHTLHVTCSSDGVTWPSAWQVPNVAIGSAPAMTVFRGALYVAFRADDPSNDVWIASSTDGVHFGSQVLSGQTMDGYSSPALAVSNNVLYYIYEANDSNHEMLVSASTDGSTWQGPAAYLGIQMGAQGPGAAAFGNGVSVGFQSNDSRNVLFVTNKVTEAASYTGPSDPNGAGPQDWFASTATEQPNVFMGSKPALASFNASLYVAFQANDSGHTLHVTSSPTGYNFPAAAQEPNVLMGSAPAMAEFNHHLFIAFQANDPGHSLHVTSSSDGLTWPAAAQEPNILIGGAPAMAVFNNKLYLAFQANDPSHSLQVTASSDGATWPAAWQIPNIKMGSDPAMTVFNGKLYVAFRADDPSNDVWIASSSDGVNFSPQVLAGQTMGGSSAPALVASIARLYYIYGANDLDNEMLVSSSIDGHNWLGPKAYPGTQMGAAGPGATAFGDGVYAGFQSNDSRNVLFVTNLTNNSSQITRPCNILALASPATPCVAAFSTIRSLDASYTGPLYQVTRASDNTAADIGMLLDSYAYAAAQDTFCANTYCTITKIYDQTSNHNDLTAAPPGQHGSGPGPNGYDLTAPAAAVPLLAGGHRVYGVYSQPGYGYRNDAAKNIPMNGAPEGVYMLSSAKGLLPGNDYWGACCFDFGNAETSNNDDNAGTMDAIRVACIGGNPCAVTAGLDMENGTYGNASVAPGTPFVLAMGWNDGQHNFGIVQGDIWTGAVTSTGTIPLPSGYAPMNQEGAIILGIGGDNSNGASGYFYEGAMTQGAPSSASLSSVMANAVSVKYSLYSGSPAGAVEDGGTYTLENQVSQMLLDNYCDGCSSAATNGVQVIQYPEIGWKTQKWTLHGQGNGYYTMVNAQSLMCLDDPWGNGTPSRTLPQAPGTSTMLWQQPCNGNAAQNWLFIAQSNGNFVIQNQAATTNHGSSMVLDVYNGLAIQGMQMWVSTANGLPPQNWHLAHQ